MATFKSIAESENNKNWKEIFSIIAARENNNADTQDGAEPIALDSSELCQIRDRLYDNVQDALTQDGASFVSVDEMRQGLLSELPQKIQQKLLEVNPEVPHNNGIVEDSYFNPVSGIGTMIDPGVSTMSSIPVSITPTEATSYYANGGIPARIINKKAGCLSLKGIHFECPELSEEDLTALEDYADKCGFTEKYGEAITQALIFGGAAMYPKLKGDSPVLTQRSISDILKQLPDEKNFIKYWVVADRWNVVYVPDYNITAQDYLQARSIFVPLGGERINTQRCAMIKPNKQPFWSAIQQMGWSVSDFEGWIRDFESYAIMKASLPIMAQQMSLMYHSMPADGLIIENGPAYARKFFEENEKQMRDWSILHPKAINSVGEIKILERTYSGFRDLINESRLALCASSSVPESILFAEKATGLASDNRDDVELKQSEVIRMLFNNTAPAFKNIIALLVYSCFGKNSEQAKHAFKVKLKADDGIMLSDQDKAQLGQSFSTIAGQFVSMGLPLKSAIDIAMKFVPSAEIDANTLAAINGNGEAEGMDENLWNLFNAGRDNGLGGMNA